MLSSFSRSSPGLTRLASCKRIMGRVCYSLKVEGGGLDYLKDDSPPKRVALLPQSKYGGEFVVTLLTGESTVGRQGASYIHTLFNTAKVPVYLERIPVGINNSDQTDEELPKTFTDDFVMSVQRNRHAIYVDTQHDPVEKAKILRLNTALNLYACVIRFNSFPGFKCRFPDVDTMLIIQNNSGDYAKLEYEPVNGMIQTLRITDADTDRRYLRFVFEHARTNNRKRITFGHKRSDLPLSDGQMMDIATDLRDKHFKDIEIEFMDISRMARKIVMEPQSFDVICTNDRYGTFIAAIASAVCGGASLFSAIELGDHHAIFKPLQTKLSLSDCRALSPYGIVRTCVDLLQFLGNSLCADALWDELMKTMLDFEVKTAEFGGSASGDFVICNIVNNLRCKFA